jgi:hypothetical protein
MPATALALQRLYQQRLSQNPLATPGEVVAWLGAVQAQDYLGALWAIGLRMQHATEADIEQAMADGVIVRTHPMRGTWHFVAAADVRWLLTLMAPRRIASNASWYRRLELDDATFAKSNAVFAKTLQGGKQLTRRELAAKLEQAGISTAGLRLTFILSRAELDAVIASGARRGKQFTFALLDELVPVSKALERDEALAELARRYFTSHGPATLQDFVWWSGLIVADARAGLEMVKSQFIKEVIGGRAYWTSPINRVATSVESRFIGGASPTAYLLPAYDEYTVAYKDRSAILDPAYAKQARNGIFSPAIVINGQIVGTWKRTMKKDAVIITPSLFTPLKKAETHSLAASANQYSAFLDMTVNFTFQVE